MTTRKIRADLLASLQSHLDAAQADLHKLMELEQPSPSRRGEHNGLWEKVRVLYARGMPIAQIAKELDVRYQSVRQCIIYQQKVQQP